MQPLFLSTFPGTTTESIPVIISPLETIPASVGKGQQGQHSSRAQGGA